MLRKAAIQEELSHECDVNRNENCMLSDEYRLGNRAKNIETARRMASDAKNKGVDVICFPELFSTGVTKCPDKFSEHSSGETFEFLSNLAKENKMCVIGSLIENVNGKAKNSCVVFDRDGNLLSNYHKIHPFTFDGEQNFYEPGDKLSFFEMSGAKCTTFICYDLRFPEIFRAAALKGAEICFVIANWPYPRQEHWRALLKARAIENQMFVVGVNRVGESPINKYFGLSSIINPLGNVLAEGKESEEDLVIADVNVSVGRDWRRKFPCLNDARYDLYKKFMNC